MNKQPLVTVITPVYNCKRFIKETLRSVLDNSYPHLEYIVINDASNDGMEPIIDLYDVRVKYIEHSGNIGEQATVNEGLRMAKGKYFFVVNADDPLLPGCIETMVDFMEAHPDVLCAYPDWRMISEDGSTKMEVKVRDYDFVWMVRHHTWLPSVGSIFREDVIKLVGYRDESFRWLGDGDYWLRIGLAGPMAHVPLTLACWRYRNGQASGQRSSERAKEHIRVMQKFFDKDNRQKIASIFDATRGGPDCGEYCSVENVSTIESMATCWSYLVASSVTGLKSETIKYLWKAIATYPDILFNLSFWDILRSRAMFYLRRAYVNN